MLTILPLRTISQSNHEPLLNILLGLVRAENHFSLSKACRSNI